MAGTQQVAQPRDPGSPIDAAPRPSERPAPETIEPEAKSGNPIVRIAGLGIGVLVLVLAIVFGLKYYAYASTHETTDDATIDADQVQVTSKIAERIARIDVETNSKVRKGQVLITLDSRDERDRVTQAQAAVDAQLAQARAAQEGVALVRDTQAAQDAQANGGIAQARAAIASAASNAQSSDGQISVAAAGVEAARAQLHAAQDAVPGALQNLRSAQADLHRVSTLVASGDIAAQQLDSARAAYETARSAYSETQAQVGTANANLVAAQQKLDAQRFAAASTQSQIGVQQAQLQTAQGKYLESNAGSRVSEVQAQADAARAQIASLAAALVTAKSNLGYTHIVSPIDGYVGQKNAEVGQTVSPGTSLLTLIPSKNLYITANFKETQIGNMKVGQRVDINVDAYKGVKFVGHVDNLSPASQNTFSLVPAQNATGNFVKVTQRLPVRILFDRVEGGDLADYQLRPGMSVETSVLVK